MQRISFYELMKASHSFAEAAASIAQAFAYDRFEFKKRGVEYCHDDLKYLKNKGTISEAKSKFRKFVKITGLDIGEIAIINENCTVRCVYKYNGEKFFKEEFFK